MDTTTNQVISRSPVCVWVTGIAFPPNWTTLPHGQHMYTWSPASWKSGQPSTTRLCHTLDNHPDNHPLAGQKHIKLPALTSVGILGNDYYWIDGERCIGKGMGSNLTHYKLHCCEEIISQSLRCYVNIQGISSHGINPATLQYSSPSTGRVNSFPPSATYMHRWTGSTLVQVMAWRRTGDGPLPEPMLIYCQLDP